MTAVASRVSKCAIDIKIGETLTLIGGGVDSQEIKLTLLHKHGQVARLLVQAPEAVKLGKPAKRSG
ncbi:hypothetical protein PEC18_18785 [Paucibacter sp. O1-1]|nr:hypothetical protein [Paucibacter sp. O1-1]MDA3827844.1 hypothetical protein [Paucibacter sp. O1-1]